MLFRLSSGLRNAIMSQYGLGLMMNGGVIKIFSGTIPNSPNDAISVDSDYLGIITTDGKIFIPGNDTIFAGLYFSLINYGTLIQSGKWVLTGKNTGLATWFRWYWADPDPDGFSTYYPRIDGDIGSTGVLKLQNYNITTSTLVEIEQVMIVLPTGI